MPVFSVSNTAQRALFIMADNEDDAKQVALTIGLITRLANARVLDVTDKVVSQPGIRELMDAGYRGSLMKRLPSYTFQQIASGEARTAPDSSKWLPMQATPLFE